MLLGDMAKSPEVKDSCDGALRSDLANDSASLSSYSGRSAKAALKANCELLARCRL